VGWEVNGGFLTGSDIQVGDGKLRALPTRDAFLPIICTLVLACKNGKRVSELFVTLPQRFTQAGLIDNFPVEASRTILDNYNSDTNQTRKVLESIFSREKGFGNISSLNFLDGIRIAFDNGDIAHIRPSGNAPQLRIYSTANSQARADEIVSISLAEPNGILRQLEALVQ
jgi:phosphomannomutase